MASFQKYITNKGERWKFTIEDGIDPVTGKRRRTTKRGFIKDKVTVEEIENTEIKDQYLEKEELQLFLNVAEKMNLESYVILHTLAWTGLRVGELVALKWSDIEFGKQTLSVTKTYYNPINNTKKLNLLPPKTKGSIRVIDIDEDVLELLRKH